MSEFYCEKESVERKSHNYYYTGYYWSNHPYKPSEITEQISDKDLKSSIVERLKKNNMTSSDEIWKGE